MCICGRVIEEGQLLVMVLSYVNYFITVLLNVENNKIKHHNITFPPLRLRIDSIESICNSKVNLSQPLDTICLPQRGARDLKKQNMHGAASLKKKKTEFPTNMHAQCKLSGEKGKFCFFKGIFQKCP